MGSVETELYKKDRNICTCERCSKGTYNPLDYMLYEEDFLRLDEERPLGLSGHLRAKNEALSVGECIESCIDFLDELIITYNDSEDNTEEILKKYATKYPNKIKLYHYKPYVINAYGEFFYHKHKLPTNKEVLEIFVGDTIRSNSIHNLANYYNYGYTKIKYRYYLKIDGDQIYFTEKILKIKKTLCNPWVYQISRFVPNIFRRIVNKIIRMLRKISIVSFLERKVFILLPFFLFHKSTSLLLGGINLVGLNDGFVIPIETTQDWGFSFFNGLAGDTAIWVPQSSHRHYFNQERLWEAIKRPPVLYQAGVCWIHLKVCEG